MRPFDSNLIYRQLPTLGANRVWSGSDKKDRKLLHRAILASKSSRLGVSRCQSRYPPSPPTPSLGQGQ